MTLEQAIKMNPYDEKIGSKSAYARYLRYTVTGFYELSNKEVRQLWGAHVFSTMPAAEQVKLINRCGKAFAEGFAEGFNKGGGIDVNGDF